MIDIIIIVGEIPEWDKTKLGHILQELIEEGVTVIQGKTRLISEDL